jgi:hypothetical protein
MINLRVTNWEAFFALCKKAHSDWHKEIGQGFVAGWCFGVPLISGPDGQRRICIY